VLGSKFIPIWIKLEILRGGHGKYLEIVANIQARELKFKRVVTSVALENKFALDNLAANWALGQLNHISAALDLTLEKP
jgi:hypothetical protein